MDFTPQETLIPLTYVISSLSVLGSLFMIFCYLFVSELRSMPIFAFVANLAFADLLLTIDGIPNLINPQTSLVDGLYCEILGGIRQLNYASSYLWAFTFGQIMWNFYKGDYRTHKDIQNNYTKIFIINWSLSLFTAIIPFFFNAYGPSLLFCWLSESIHGIEYILLTGFLGYLPGFILGFILIYYYVVIIRHMRRNTKNKSEDAPDIIEMILYPSIFLLTIIFVGIDRVFFANYENNLIIVAVHIILRQGQGFFNCLAYGMNSQVRRTLKKSCQKRNQVAIKNFSLPKLHNFEAESNRSSLFSDYSKRSEYEI